MNRAKCNEQDYINFLIATQQQYSCVEAAKVQPEGSKMPSHDAFTRLLTRLEPSAEALWEEAKSQVERSKGVLLIDDSTLDRQTSSGGTRDQPGDTLMDRWRTTHPL